MSGWNASGSGCCQGWWGESQETIRGGICCTKPLRVGQGLPVCWDSTLSFVWAHCLSCSWMTGVDTCHPTLSERLFVWLLHMHQCFWPPLLGIHCTTLEGGGRGTWRGWGGESKPQQNTPTSRILPDTQFHYALCVQSQDGAALLSITSVTDKRFLQVRPHKHLNRVLVYKKKGSYQPIKANRTSQATGVRDHVQLKERSGSSTANLTVTPTLGTLCQAHRGFEPCCGFVLRPSDGLCDTQTRELHSRVKGKTGELFSSAKWESRRWSSDRQVICVLGSPPPRWSPAYAWRSAGEFCQSPRTSSSEIITKPGHLG